MLFFQLMTRRYEHASTVLTSNKGFEEWGDIFGDDVMAAVAQAATTVIRPPFRERRFRRITISTSWSTAVNRFIRRSTEKPASL